MEVIFLEANPTYSCWLTVCIGTLGLGGWVYNANMCLSVDFICIKVGSSLFITSKSRKRHTFYWKYM